MRNQYSDGQTYQKKRIMGMCPLDQAYENLLNNSIDIRRMLRLCGNIPPPPDTPTRASDLYMATGAVVIQRVSPLASRLYVYVRHSGLSG